MFKIGNDHGLYVIAPDSKSRGCCCRNSRPTMSNPLILLHKSIWANWLAEVNTSYQHRDRIWVRSRNCGCLVTWFCYQLIAKPGNKTATVSWPDPYIATSGVRRIPSKVMRANANRNLYFKLTICVYSRKALCRFVGTRGQALLRNQWSRPVACE